MDGARGYLCQGGLQDGGAGNGDDADVVLLAEALGGGGYLGGGAGGAQKLGRTLKAEELAVGVRGLHDTV